VSGAQHEWVLNGLNHAMRDTRPYPEITTIDVEFPRSADNEKFNPWFVTAGMFQDDPLLEAMLQELYALRDTPETVE